MGWVDLVHRFWNGRSGKYGWVNYGGVYRDEVRVCNGATYYFLHEHDIAVLKDGKLYVYDHRWVTKTTYNRLSAILSRINFNAFRVNGLYGVVVDNERNIYYGLDTWIEIDLKTRNVRPVINAERFWAMDQEAFEMAIKLYNTLRRYRISLREIIHCNFSRVDMNRLKRKTREMISLYALKRTFFQGGRMECDSLLIIKLVIYPYCNRYRYGLKINVCDEKGNIIIGNLVLHSGYMEKFSEWIKKHAVVGVDINVEGECITISYEMNKEDIAFLNLLKGKSRNTLKKLLDIALTKGVDYIIISEVLKRIKS